MRFTPRAAAIVVALGFVFTGLVVASNLAGIPGLALPLQWAAVVVPAVVLLVYRAGSRAASGASTMDAPGRMLAGAVALLPRDRRECLGLLPVFGLPVGVLGAALGGLRTRRSPAG